MINKTNWRDTKARWNGYWKRANEGRPLMRVVARRPEIEAEYQKAQAAGKPFMTEALMPADMDDMYLNAERIVERFRYYCERHDFLAESFPNISLDFGPGSVAAYLGSDIKFRLDTIWFSESVTDWEAQPPLTFDAQNRWWQRHVKLVTDVKAMAQGDFYLTIPDLMENIDVIASLRGAQNTMYDLIDEPEEIKRRIDEIDAVYFEYYNRFYDLVKNPEDNGSAYTVFQIWGAGRTAKLQCDFSAMMSPGQFKEFIQPSLRKQAQRLDHVLYHLDGPDAIRHLDALMEIDAIDALQWTSGDYGPDGTFPEWDVIYDKARAAGKSLWIKVYSGEFEEWLTNVDRIIEKYGSYGTFLYFPEMSRAAADRLITHAETNWSNVPGTHGFKR